MAKQSDSKSPKIRFVGFEDEWEEKAFLETTSKIGSGKTPTGGDSSYVSQGVALIRSQNITNNSVFLQNVAFITHETDNEMVNSRVKKNDVLLNITGASIGRSAVYRLPEYANVNQHVCIIRPLEGFNADFIQLHLASIRGQRKIDNSQAGGARQGLNFQQIGGMKFDYPSPAEQTKIGGYFRELDRLIGLQQRKHDKLVTLKKAMLQKMFPQPGATTPEIRFQGFSAAWEEKKLGEVSEFNPKCALPEIFEYVDLESVVGTQMVNHRTEARRTAPSRAQRLARQGDLFFQTVRPYQKNNHLFTLPHNNYVFSTGYAQIRPNHDGSFLLGLMQRDQFVKVVLDNCTGTSYPAINSNVWIFKVFRG